MESGRVGEAPALQIDGLTKHFPVRRGAFGRSSAQVRAVDGVDLTVRRGQTFGLVGESGCGKTTLASLVLKLLEPTAGHIKVDGRDIAGLRGDALKDFRRGTQMVFQDPQGSLDPRQTVLSALMEPLLTLRVAATRAEARDTAAATLGLVGLGPEILTRLPHELSGGQRQRVVIARALGVAPRLVLLDEPTASLDVSVQAQILSLVADLKARQGLTYLLISHNLVVTRCMSDVVAVMYLGKIVETAAATALFTDPLHPYSAALISAIPVPDPDTRGFAALARGDVPSPVALPSGCRYHPRCQFVERVCQEQEPPLQELASGHHVACHFPGVASIVTQRQGGASQE
jgi:peptide/nickel transport system ATP-binding protein